MIFTPLQYLKAGALLVLLAIFLWGAATVRHWRNDSLRLSDVEARSAAQVAEARAALAATETAYKAAQMASKGYQDELQTLRAARKPARVVRLCDDVPPDHPAGHAWRGPDGPTTPTGGVPADARPDIGPDLYALADRCDEVSAQLRALQGFIGR